MATQYQATPCPCRHRGCSAWHVDPVAAIQGVRFDEQQAKDVAAFLNARETAPNVLAAAPDMLAALRDAQGALKRAQTALWLSSRKSLSLTEYEETTKQIHEALATGIPAIAKAIA